MKNALLYALLVVVLCVCTYQGCAQRMWGPRMPTFKDDNYINLVWRQRMPIVEYKKTIITPLIDTVWIPEAHLGARALLIAKQFGFKHWYEGKKLHVIVPPGIGIERSVTFYGMMYSRTSPPPLDSL